MTILQSLKSLSAYPIPSATVQDIAEECGLQLDAELAPELRNAPEMMRAKAHIYSYLAAAPAIAQNGVSFSFSAEERKQFRRLAKNLLRGTDDPLANGMKYGYIGEDF